MLVRIKKRVERMKKRVVISIILTALAILGSHNYWLHVKPINVTFDAQGKNIQNIEVQLSKYDSPEFKKFKAQNKNVKLDKKQKLSFEFKKPFAPKRLKLVLVAKSAQGGGVSLSNVTLRDKIHLNDLENFSANNATLKIKDNKLFIIPHRKDFSITYNKKLNVRASLKLDILVLLIIAIITYLVAFKFTSYLADFKINKEKSRIDIVFLAIFFLIMFIPMMRISNEKTSKSENRTLATYKPLFKTKGGLNFSYGKDFDKWFSDRFNLRKELVSLDTNLNYKLRIGAIERHKILLNKNTHWFTNINFHRMATKTFDENELKTYLHNLLELEAYCNKNNKQLYVLFVPEKGTIYNEEIFRYRYNSEDKNTDTTRQISEYIAKNSDINVSYPFDLLYEAKKHQLIYYKNDHHMNDFGNLIYFNNFLKIYNKTNNTNIPLLTEKDFNVVKNNQRKIEGNPHKFTNGSEYIAFNTNDKKLLDTTYSHYFAKPDRKLINKTVYVFGDSYSMQFKQFFNNTFRKNYFTPTQFMTDEELHNFAKTYRKEIVNSDVIVVIYAGMACPRIIKMDFSILNEL